MSSNTKVVYSNRLVSKHEQFIIDKSLANKIKHVKSTIISGNQTFEKMISNRNKKDVQRSFICKLKSLDDPLDSETAQSENNPLFSSPHSREVSTKRSEIQPLRLITPLASENNENRVNSSFSVRSGPLPLLISPRIGIENRLGLKTPVYELSNVRVNNGSLSPMRVPSNGLKNMKTEKNENLKNKLIEKSLEIEALRSEMKDWRHYDQRGRIGYSKENIAEDSPRKRSEISTAVSSQQSGLKATKAVFGGKIMMNGLSSKAQSDKRLKKMGELETSDVRQMIKYVAKPATYEESLRILERFEEIERNKKNRVSVQRDQEKRTDRSQVMESPKTPIFKAVPNNLKFSTRFSRNLESGLLKANMRYSTEEVDLEEEQEKAESGLEGQENGERGKGFGLNMKHKYIDNRKKTIELDGEEQSEEETKVYTKAKTIIFQPKNLNFKLNSHSFRLPQVTRGEVSATE